MTAPLDASQFFATAQALTLACNRDRYRQLLDRNNRLLTAYRVLAGLPEGSEPHRAILAYELVKDLPMVSNQAKANLQQLALHAAEGRWNEVEQ